MIGLCIRFLTPLTASQTELQNSSYVIFYFSKKIQNKVESDGTHGAWRATRQHWWCLSLRKFSRLWLLDDDDRSLTWGDDCHVLETWILCFFSTTTPNSSNFPVQHKPKHTEINIYTTCIFEMTNSWHQGITTTDKHKN